MTACLLAWALVAIAAQPSQPSESFWFRETVEWQYGKEGLPWERIGTLPGANQDYRLALQPLWAVEGGILGFEIILATPDKPFDNLLGERDPKIQQPFAFYLRDLQRGIGLSKFGSTRSFVLPKPAKGRLRIRVLNWKPGRGVGSCDDCVNIEALTANVEIESK